MVWGVCLPPSAFHRFQEDERVGEEDVVQLTNAQIHVRRRPGDVLVGRPQYLRGVSTLLIKDRRPESDEYYALAEFSPAKTEFRAFDLDLYKDDQLSVLSVGGCNFELHLTGNLRRGVVRMVGDARDGAEREGGIAETGPLPGRVHSDFAQFDSALYGVGDRWDRSSPGSRSRSPRR